MKVAIIIGTKAELIKMFPIMQELEKQKIEYDFIATGQHKIDDLCDLLKIKRPDLYLTNPPKKAYQKFLLDVKKALWESIFIYRNKLYKIFERDYDFIMIHGDTASTAAVAYSFFIAKNMLRKKIKSKLVHIEAGLRSWDLLEPFPEEICRVVADCFSDILFTVSRISHKNVKKQFPRKKYVFLTGNTIVDAALYAYEIGKKELKEKPPNEEYGIVTIHRHENLKSKIRMLKIVKILQYASKKIKLYLFTHKNTEMALKKYDLWKYIKKNKNIITLSTKSYPKFIVWLANSKIIFTDGGSMQEESLIFKVPCILLRKKTERIEGLKTGLNFLSRLEFSETKKKIDEFLSDDFKIPKFRNPYGEPGVCKKIVNIIRKLSHTL